ncbi:MAG: GNAT family N-acetyltransferase [Provencibacterium sp.]|nr:GNAT family N-acetyltransferase [Provencibacterium sp.]
MEKTGLNIRVADSRDAPELLKIYAPYVKQTAITFEYKIPSLQEFADRIEKTLKSYPYLTAELDGEIVGYAYAGSFHERAAYRWAVETSLYIAGEHKRRGIGRALYLKLEEILAFQHIVNLNACIACPQQVDPYLTRDSIDFHRQMGFRLVGEFHQCGYKFGRWYNMVWMEKQIGAHLAQPPPVRPFEEIKDRFL